MQHVLRPQKELLKRALGGHLFSYWQVSKSSDAKFSNQIAGPPLPLPLDFLFYPDEWSVGLSVCYCLARDKIYW